MEQFKHRKTGIVVKKYSPIFYQESDNHQFVYRVEIIENSTDWEKVKDYTILYYEKNGGVYKNDPDKHYNLRGDFSIYSVRRESDGLIFAIEDNYPSITGGETKIKEFKITQQDNIVIITKEGNTIDLIFWRKPIKQKLFTTQDGVDICKGESYAFIVRDKTDLYQDWKIVDQPYAQEQHVLQDKAHPGRYINFSTKERAEEYVIRNKSCISYIDLLDLQHNIDKSMIHINREHLEKFIKSKLNL